MEKKEIILMISNIIIALSTLSGVIIAFFGLTTWRKQLHGTADYELARRLLLNVYQLRDSIRKCRNPWLSTAEVKNSKVDWEIIAYQQRWDSVTKSARELQVCVTEAEVLWGSTSADIMKMANKLNSKLFISIQHFVDSKKNPSKKFTEDDERIIYNMSGTEPDNYEKELLEIVEKFEKLAKPHLPRKS